MTTQAAKGRTLLSLAAVCALALVVVAPSPASAMRTGPGLERPSLGPLPAALDGLLEAPGAACPDWVKSTAGYAVGLGQSAGELVAAPVTMAGTEAVNAYYNTARVVDAYRAGGMSRALEESEIISDGISAESKHRLLGMIPGVNACRQGSKVVATYEEEGACAVGMRLGRTTFSLGLDATVVCSTGRLATARAALAPSTSTPKVNLLNNKVRSNASVAELGVVAGANSAARAASESETVANPVPRRIARVVDARFAESPRLAARGAEDVFVTAADEIAGARSSSELASRLTLIDDAGNLRQGPFAVIEFETWASGVAYPVFRTHRGFVQGGTTARGAAEYVLHNLELFQLEDVNITVVS